MNSFIYSPRSGKEILAAAPAGTKIYVYSDLCQRVGDPAQILLSLPSKCIILLQNPKNMRSGHWIALSRNTRKREMYYFSSYGGKPDVEMSQWVTPEARMRSGQGRNLINDGLKELCANGWTIFYNDFTYQKKGDRTATCGIWATAFLHSGLNPDEFEENHEDEGYYFRHFFN